MPEKSKPDANTGIDRKLRVVFAVITTVIIVISGIAVFEYLNNVRPNQQSAQVPSEPMPALLLSNLLIGCIERHK